MSQQFYYFLLKNLLAGIYENKFITRCRKSMKLLDVSHPQRRCEFNYTFIEKWAAFLI